MSLVAACAGGDTLMPAFTMHLPGGAFGMRSNVSHGMQNQNMSLFGCYLWHEQQRTGGKAKQPCYC